MSDNFTFKAEYSSSASILNLISVYPCNFPALRMVFYVPARRCTCRSLVRISFVSEYVTVLFIGEGSLIFICMQGLYRTDVCLKHFGGTGYTELQVPGNGNDLEINLL